MAGGETASVKGLQEVALTRENWKDEVAPDVSDNHRNDCLISDASLLLFQSDQI